MSERHVGYRLADVCIVNIMSKSRFVHIVLELLGQQDGASKTSLADEAEHLWKLVSTSS